MNPEERAQMVADLYEVITDNLDAQRDPYDMAVDIVLAFERRYAPVRRDDVDYAEPGPEPEPVEEPVKVRVDRSRPPRRGGTR